MMTSWTQHILQSYDQCKHVRTAEECRQLASVGASQSVKGYLRGYDTCIELFGLVRCRQMLSSPKTANVTVAILAFVGGFVVGRLLK